MVAVNFLFAFFPFDLINFPVVCHYFPDKKTGAFAAFTTFVNFSHYTVSTMYIPAFKSISLSNHIYLFIYSNEMNTRDDGNKQNKTKINEKDKQTNTHHDHRQRN